MVGTAGGRKVAKSTKMLSALSVNAISKPGYHADGDGLYLQVAKGGTKSWVYRYTKGGKRREMGLGPFSKVTELPSLTESAIARDAIQSVGACPNRRVNARVRAAGLR